MSDWVQNYVSIDANGWSWFDYRRSNKPNHAKKESSPEDNTGNVSGGAINATFFDNRAQINFLFDNKASVSGEENPAYYNGPRLITLGTNVKISDSFRISAGRMATVLGKNYKTIDGLTLKYQENSLSVDATVGFLPDQLTTKPKENLAWMARGTTKIFGAEAIIGLHQILDGNENTEQFRLNLDLSTKKLLKNIEIWGAGELDFETNHFPSASAGINWQISRGWKIGAQAEMDDAYADYKDVFGPIDTAPYAKTSYRINLGYKTTDKYNLEFNIAPEVGQTDDVVAAGGRFNVTWSPEYLKLWLAGSFEMGNGKTYSDPNNFSFFGGVKTTIKDQLYLAANGAVFYSGDQKSGTSKSTNGIYISGHINAEWKLPIKLLPAPLSLFVYGNAGSSPLGPDYRFLGGLTIRSPHQTIKSKKRRINTVPGKKTTITKRPEKNLITKAQVLESFPNHEKEIENCSDCHTSKNEKFLEVKRFDYSTHKERASSCQSCHVSSAAPTCEKCHSKKKVEERHGIEITKKCTEFCHKPTSINHSNHSSKWERTHNKKGCFSCHTGQSKVACATCHSGAGANFTQYIQRESAPNGKAPHHRGMKSLESCSNCHKPEVCQTCHSNTLLTSRFDSHENIPFFTTKNHGQAARTNTRRCFSCHPQTTCISCHQQKGVVKR